MSKRPMQVIIFLHLCIDLSFPLYVEMNFLSYANTCYLLPLDNNLPRNYSKLKEKIGLGNVSIKTKKYCEICKILLEESEY